MRNLLSEETRSKKNTLPKPKYGSAVADEMIAGMQSLIDDLKSGKGITVRELAIVDPVPEMTPADVLAVRQSLNLSQPLFADFIGSSTSAVRAWERGAKVPTPMARRFLDAIRSDPEYWKKRLFASSTSKRVI